MPSNKIYVALIICVALVVSTWLISKKHPTTVASSDAATISVVEKPIISTNDDWQKTLSTIDQSAATINNSGSSFDDTTLTAQMARDFFAQYLQSAKGGQDLTSDQAQQIAENTLSLPEYTKSTGAVYTSANLHVTSSDETSIQNYHDSLIENLRKNTLKEKIDPLAILAQAIQSNDEKGLPKIDPLIVNIKAIISSLLKITVPNDAVSIHLGLLNAYSNILANVESMRVAFSDPVRAFAGFGQYDNHVTDLSTAIKKINNYFQGK